MTTDKAVGELIDTAFRQFGGKGRAGARVLRNKGQRKDSMRKKCDDCRFYTTKVVHEREAMRTLHVCTNDTLASDEIKEQFPNRIGLPLDMARDVCDKEGDGVFVGFEAKGGDVRQAYQPEPVELDRFGQWSHTAIKSLGEQYDDVEFSEIPHFGGLEWQVIRFSDEENELLCGPDISHPADFRKWMPEQPVGEGWFPFSFSEDDNGPYALYVRNKTEVVNG